MPGISDGPEYGHHSDEERPARNLEMNDATSAENSVVPRKRSTHLIP
jgi:hypothetical protein